MYTAERPPREGASAPFAPLVPRWLARGEHDLPEDDAWLSAAEAEAFGRMRFAKRRREFQTSRWAAKQALATLPGCACAEPARLEVRRHPTGAPEAWADGRALPVGISLSDRAGWAVCLLGLGPGAVGCDLELVEPRSAGFVRDYFTAAERRFIEEGRQDGLRANLLWSAKESALKVLRTGLRRDTRSVEITASLSGGASGWCALTARVDRARTFTGWWARYNDFLLTVVTAAPTPQPVGIDAVAALTAAVPVHSWLDAPLSPVLSHAPSLAPTRR